MARSIYKSLIDRTYFNEKPIVPMQVPLGKVDDYFSTFAALRSQFGASYLLESLLDNEHSDPLVTFGFDPVLSFSARGQQMKIRSADKTETITFSNPYQELAKMIPQNFASESHQGGLVGYVGYEGVNYFEPSLNLEEHPDFPTFEFGLYLDGLVYNKTTRELTYYHFEHDRSEVVHQAMVSSPNIGQIASIERHGHTSTKDEHREAIDYALDQIKSGNSFQAEIGFKTKYTIDGDKLAVYERLREVNPGPYMYYLKFDHRELFGSSPEIIVRNAAGALITTPAAGTVGRGETPEEDDRLGRKLQTDEKEIAEHNMLIDLHRNDLAKVSKVGSVSVDKAKYIAKFSHVQHMLSDITGELREDKTSFDMLAAMTPCGVLTGAPKIETIKIIKHTEPEPRGPYGGAVGRFSFNGDGVFTMPIRSLFCAGDACYAQTASGVVLDSTAEGEYQEVIRKLAAMEKVIASLSEESTA